MALIGLFVIATIILLKYKPTYAVQLEGQRVGYVEDKSKFEEKVSKEIREYSGKNIESVSLNTEPSYELKFIDRSIDTNEEEVIAQIQEDATIKYKYYEISLNDTEKTYVETMEEAETIVNNINEETAKEDIDLQLTINKVVTENAEEIKTENIETAKEILAPEVQEQVEKIEEERNAPIISGIKLAVTPVTGTITSRFGVSSRIRSSTHTGLDIACPSGTDIKAVSDGVVTSVTSGGAYGNLLKINHGNGVETWYAHCSKIIAKEGQKIKAGDIVAAVGSTGNSTGPHLHLEIRLNGNPVNPQDYLYK